MDYFKRLLELLKLEQREDRKAYDELMAKSSLTDRRTNGLSWYPVAIRGSEITRGDYITVELERTTHQDIAHQLRFGASAALFSNHDPKNNRLEGIISFQSRDRLKLTLRTDELPDWSQDGKLGVDLLFDEYSYDEMKNALKVAATLVEKVGDGNLIRVLTGFQPATFKSHAHSVSSSRLNPSQQDAVNKILAANDLAIVHGPPGTGKTTTLVQAVKMLIAQEPQKILVAAPSNTAVDLLTEQLHEEGLNVVRIGNPARVSDKLMALTLDNKIAEHGSMKELKKLRKQAAEYIEMAHKYKRHFGRAEREQRKALFEESRNIRKQVENNEQYIIDDVLAKAQVITATLVGSNHYTIRNIQFQTVVIDEAGQAIEPACWIPVLKAKKLIFAGDHYQLPPTIKSSEAAINGLGTTLFEKCISMHADAVTLLDEQYRMHETIMGFSSKEFYQNKLKAHPSVAQRLLFPNDSPLSFVDTAGCGFEEKAEGTSTTNPEEAAFLFSHLTQLVAQLNNHYKKETFPSIAVISPYKEQTYLLQEHLLNSELLQAHSDKISVNTIDSFQGQERDVVYIGMTRSNIENKIGFLADIRRMNVAMTRARRKLVIIGDSATISQLSFYADFISYTELHDCYQSAWDFVDM